MTQAVKTRSIPTIGRPDAIAGRISAGRFTAAALLLVLATACSDRTSRQLAEAPIARGKNNQPFFDLSHVETESVKFQPAKAEPMFPPASGARRANTSWDDRPYKMAEYRVPSERERAYHRARRIPPAPSRPPESVYRSDDIHVPPPAGYQSAVPQPVWTQPIGTPESSHRPAVTPAHRSPQRQAAVPPGQDHVVRQGESLGSIAQGYNRSVDSLAKANRLPAPYVLTVGQALRIPGSGPAPAVGGRHHTVQSGDTVYSIARLNGIDINALMRMNGIEPPYTIAPGQRLSLPSDARQTATPGAPFDGVIPLSARIPALAQGPMVLTRTPNRVRDKLKLPVQGPVVARFGPLPNGGRTDGMVFSAPRGSDVVAAENGVVAYAGNAVPGYGDMVMVVHAGGWTTVYAHADELLVRRGEMVGRGQPIARVGATGSARSPALLFELRYGSEPVDPEPYFDTAGQQISVR